MKERHDSIFSKSLLYCGRKSEGGAGLFLGLKNLNKEEKNIESKPLNFFSTKKKKEDRKWIASRMEGRSLTAPLSNCDIKGLQNCQVIFSMYVIFTYCADSN